MAYRIIKYVLLAGFFLFTMYQIIPFGDYCSGIVEVLLFIVFGGLFVVSFIIFLAIDIFRTFRKKSRFDFIPIILMIIFIGTNLLIYGNESPRFWKKVQLKGVIEKEFGERGELILYTDGTFDAKCRFIELSCTYTGEYTINDNVLTLIRKNIEELTDSTFTTKYLIESVDSLNMTSEVQFKELK
jgi:hypothetical protein